MHRAPSPTSRNALREPALRLAPTLLASRRRPHAEQAQDEGRTAAAGVDLVTIQAAMGHSALATTGRYLHARPASEQAAAPMRGQEIHVAAYRQWSGDRRVGAPTALSARPASLLASAIV
jgi:hypothetical protein